MSFRRAETHLMTLMREFHVVAIVGPRQYGTSTLAHRILPRLESSVYLDLCLDEIRRYPDLVPVLRALVDRARVPGRFLILGSASPGLLHQSTESLARRIAYVELTPFTATEVPAT